MSQITLCFYFRRCSKREDVLATRWILSGPSDGGESFLVNAWRMGVRRRSSVHLQWGLSWLLDLEQSEGFRYRHPPHLNKYFLPTDTADCDLSQEPN